MEDAVKHEQEAKSQRFLKEAMNKLAALYILETCIVLETKLSTAQDNNIEIWQNLALILDIQHYFESQYSITVHSLFGRPSGCGVPGACING